MIGNSKRSIRLLSWRTLRWAIALPTLPLVWWACTSHPLAQPIPAPEQQTDIYISVSPQRLLDLVFMIDNSPSMAPKVTKLNKQFPKLINALKDPNDGTLPDLRVAIIDSDLGTYGQYASGSSCGSKTLSDGTVSLYGDMGRFQMINTTASNPTPCGVTSPDATYLEYASGSPVNFTGDINTVFTCLAGNLGTLGCGEEHQLQAYEFALYAQVSDVNTAQHSMLRANAYLGLVFLTDEDDCSAAPNDTMFGAKTELANESASLRCATRAHVCENGKKDLAISPPGYPTDAPYTAPFASCSARTDTCDFSQVDVSKATPNCSPLRDIPTLASEMKQLKDDPDQILVAGIFGWPLSDADMAKAVYKIDKTPNPSTQDTAHPTIWDYWPVCYDPTKQPADPNTYDADAAGVGATGGLRNAAFVDQFGDNGLKFSICQTDFTDSMKKIGDTIAKKLQNLCVDYKLWKDANGNPDCRVAFRYPSTDPNDSTKLVWTEDSKGMPECASGATSDTISEDCWKVDVDMSKCPNAYNGQIINVLRTRKEIDKGALPAGTKVGMQCRTCTDFVDSNGKPLSGCE